MALNRQSAINYNNECGYSQKAIGIIQMFVRARTVGYFDNQTVEAVYQMQQSPLYGFKAGVADGMVGPSTLGVMIMELEHVSRMSEAAVLKSYCYKINGQLINADKKPQSYVPPKSPAPTPIAPPPKNGVTDFLDEMIKNKPTWENTILGVVGTVASEALGKIEFEEQIKVWKSNGLGWAAGAIIQPLVWAYQGNTGDWGDKLLYGLGLFPPLGLAAGAVGIWKSIVDKRVLEKVDEIKADEPYHLARTIYPTATYHWTAQPEQCAYKIASMGGVAWQHPNGQWVFSKLEKNGKTVLTCDTKPKNAVKIVGPELPLRWSGSGFVWRNYKGGF